MSHVLQVRTQDIMYLSREILSRREFECAKLDQNFSMYGGVSLMNKWSRGIPRNKFHLNQTSMEKLNKENANNKQWTNFQYAWWCKLEGVIFILLNIS